MPAEPKIAVGFSEDRELFNLLDTTPRSPGKEFIRMSHCRSRPPR